ncbi:MAG: hypothetical protein K8H74_08165 [Notoacmeibacter sp.]|nr:hypothetical protein [Notoacmeibacter sp.]
MMKAAFHLYHGTTLDDVVESFENDRGPKGFYGVLKPTRFFDAERREQGLWYGTADCFVIAAEELSEEATAFISRTIAQNGEAK